MGTIFLTSDVMKAVRGNVTPVPAAVVVNAYEFREAEDPSIRWIFWLDNLLHYLPTKIAKIEAMMNS